MILFLKLKGILGIFAIPQTKLLKYNPVPPTTIGTLFFFLFLVFF